MEKIKKKEQIEKSQYIYKGGQKDIRQYKRKRKEEKQVKKYI